MQFKRIVGVCLLLVLVAALSCERMDPDDGRRAAKLSFSVEGFDEVTYSAPTLAENTVGEAVLLFFETTYGIYMGSSNTDNGSGSGTFGELSYSLPYGVADNTKYDVLVLANYSGYSFSYDGNNIDLGDTQSIFTALGGQTYSDVKGGLTAEAPDAGITENKLLMVGTCEGMVASGLSVKLTKCAIRIKLNINSSITNFTLDGASLYNATKNCYPFSNVSDATAYNVTSEVSPSSGVVTLYAFPRSVAGCTSGDKKTLCLIVRGKYNGGASTYYRVNVKKTGTTQVLNRNTAYAIAISSVAGSGYTTVNDAYNSADSRIGYGFDSWDDTDLNEAIVYDASKSSSLHVNRQAVTLGFAKDEQQVVTATVVGNGVSCVDASTNASWLSVTRSGSQYTFKTLSANTTAIDRSATVYITTSNGLKIPITVVQKKLRVEDFKLELTSEPTIGAGETSKLFDITTAGAGVVPVATVTNSWSVSSISENSLTIAPPGGAQPINASAPARSCKLTLTCNVNGGSLSRDFTIVQNGREAKLEPYADNKVNPFDCDGEARTYKFTPSYGEVASAVFDGNSSGFSISTISNNQFTITAYRQDVLGAPARSCMVKVTGQNGAVYRFKIEQEPVVVASGSEGVMPSGGSVFWFNRNVGAASSLFFTNSDPFLGGASYEAIGDYIQFDPSKTDYCTSNGAGYVVPTKDHFESLIPKLKKVSLGNNVYVFYFDGFTETNAKRRVFFPTGGFEELSPTSTSNAAYKSVAEGYWWSSTKDANESYCLALYLNNSTSFSSLTDITKFIRGFVYVGNTGRRFNIRCVKPAN